MEMSEIISCLSSLESELNDILAGKEPPKHNVIDPNKTPKSDETLRKENEKLKSDLDALKEASKKLIEDFDKANNTMRELKKENEELKNRIDNLQKNYVDTGTLTKQNTAYGKAFGEILGAIEHCKESL